MDDAVTIVILILAAWRTTALLVDEEGPFEVFSRLRHFLGVRYDEASMPYGDNWLAKGLVCFYCVSVWSGTLWMLVYVFLPEMWATILALPFALSTGAIIVEKIHNG